MAGNASSHLRKFVIKIISFWTYKVDFLLNNNKKKEQDKWTFFIAKKCPDTDRHEEIHDAAIGRFWSTVKRGSNWANTVTLNYWRLDPPFLQTQRKWHIHVPTGSLLCCTVKSGREINLTHYLSCIILGVITQPFSPAAQWDDGTCNISTELFLFDPEFNEPFTK